jgi:hypothetical protein
MGFATPHILFFDRGALDTQRESRDITQPIESHGITNTHTHRTLTPFTLQKLV